MTTATFRTTPSLLSPLVRAGIAVAAVAFVAGAWIEAGQSSHQAVQVARGQLERTYVTLPTVDVVATRERPAHVAARPARRTVF